MAYHNNIATPALPPACLACLPATHLLGVFVLRIPVDYLDWNSASLISPSVPLYADSPLLFSSTDNLRGGFSYIIYIFLGLLFFLLPLLLPHLFSPPPSLSLLFSLSHLFVQTNYPALSVLPYCQTKPSLLSSKLNSCLSFFISLSNKTNLPTVNF